eukprot:2125678-Prymnesium_polylepis.1
MRMPVCRLPLRLAESDTTRGGSHSSESSETASSCRHATNAGPPASDESSLTTPWCSCSSAPVDSRSRCSRTVSYICTKMSLATSGS